MNLDIIYVTYNSEKWITNCFHSIKNSEYDLKKINIYVVDNGSVDGTLYELEKSKKYLVKEVSSFNIIKSNENLGFGKANNLAFKQGKSDIVCFLNIDTEVFPNTFNELKHSVESSGEKFVLWEFRQFPYEHPKFYNILTGETSWSSGAAFAIKRNIYHEVNGFDEKIFMYAEDVDLSWRIRSEGYKLMYCPSVTINHYSYENANQVKPNQYINSIINNLLLRYRFGNVKDIIKGNLMIFKLMKNKGPFEHSRKMLLKRYLKHFFEAGHFINWRFKKRKNKELFNANFLGWDYEIIREGAFYKNKYPKSNPTVSIIVRTCNRPSVLRETLISLRKQTYRNIEIVIVEDGENISEYMINTEFKDLNIIYHSTEMKVGRSRAGNIALKMSNGEYINFLDDDDLFFADHVEVLVSNLENSSYRAAYTLAYETPITVESREPYIYTEKMHSLIYNQSFNRLLLFHHNYIPIQAIMFEKTLFLENGGLDEMLDALEDWDLWVRYALKNDFLYINKATSIYRVPFDKNISEERQLALDEALIEVRAKHNSYITIISSTMLSNDLQEALDSYSIKISAEVMARLEQRIPTLVKIINKSKIIIKKILR